MKQKVLIDNRKREDVLREFEKLSKSYVPEWSMDTDKPDIGTTLSLIYANQVSDNIESINQIVDRYHAEFINLLDISINPAIPAKSIVVMDLAQDTIEGTLVPKGTRLLSSDTSNGEAIIFEVSDNVYITGAKIDNIFMTDREEGSIASIYGKLDTPSILSSEQDETLEEYTDLDNAIEEILADDITVNKINPFKLYGKMDNAGKNAVMFYHSCIFDIEDNDIFVRISGNDDLINDINKGNKYFAYAADNGVERVEECSLCKDGKTFRLRKAKPNKKQVVDGNKYSMLAIIADDAIKEDVTISDISFSSKGKPSVPEFVGNELTELETKAFEPFNQELSLYQEFYIGFDDYFKKANAEITGSFELRFDSHLLSLTPEEEAADLKIIKKKPTMVPSNLPVDVYAQKISVEYYNGIGWKKLKTDVELSQIFSEAKAGHIEFKFNAPSDWEPSVSGGYDGRQIRIVLLRADNCYYRPSVHHYPIISNLSFSFSYEDKNIKPERVRAIAGTRYLDLQKALNGQEDFSIFRVSEYDTDALYIGLSKRPVSGPVSLMIAVEEGVKYNPLSCVFEYSSIDGFKPLKVADGTYDMTRSGLVMFLPPADFCAKKIEGNKKFYLRIRRKDVDSNKETDAHLPVISDIRLNAVEAVNTDSYPEIELYLDEITVGAKFSLPQSKILSADVWVNETSSLPLQAKKDLMSKEPDRCRVEYDILGNISSFYVLWDEVERFEYATHKRVYELDRLSSTIIFGNGIDTDIPRQTDDVALAVSVKCCQGNKGNVKEYSINSSFGRLLYIGDIYNPIKGYGGSDMESVEAALVRGSNIISNRRRLVSKNDYLSEVLSFSDRIDKVRCLIGEDLYGRDEAGAITLVLLMKDYLQGSYSFHEISSLLKNHILSRCSVTVPDNKLYIVEPVFVDISVTAWVKADRMQEAFEIQNSMNNMLKDYLDPVSTMHHKGWKIGSIPTLSQIQMKVNSFRKSLVVKNVSVVASYTDAYGYHESALKELDVKHFMISRSGNHTIHVDI